MDPENHNRLHRSPSKFVRPDRMNSMRRRPLVANNATRIADNFARSNSNPQYGYQQPHLHHNLGDEPLDNEEQREEFTKYDAWMYLVCCSTICIPNFVLRWCGKRDKEVQWAWREKMTLIFLIAFACMVLAFMTFGLQASICQPNDSRLSLSQPPNYPGQQAWAIAGQWYILPDDYMNSRHPASRSAINSLFGSGSREITNMFATSLDTSACNGITTGSVPVDVCSVEGVTAYCHSTDLLARSRAQIGVSYEWSDLEDSDKTFVVYNGIVLDLTRYLAGGQQFLGNQIHEILLNSIGRDATMKFHQLDVPQEMQCLVQKYGVGYLSKSSVGCFASQTLNYIVLAVIMTLICGRFLMAVIYAFFVSPYLSHEPELTYLPPGVEPPKSDSYKSKQDSLNVNRRKSMLPPMQSRFSSARPEEMLPMTTFATTDAQKRQTITNTYDLSKYDPEMFACHVIILLTVYSESHDELQKSLVSISQTNYPDRHKLVFMVVDGLIGNTPQVCLDLLNLKNKDPLPMSYIAIADGSRQHNMAKVYYGTFDHGEAAVPIILVIKCGAPAEAKEAKPGNRGKRDSQIVLMNLLSKIMFDDRMTALEYDLFTKMRKATGVMPDRYEIVLMVDADTKVMPDSLPLMVNTMRNDTKLMGVCGETQIANPNDTWVTLIQVYEYFISHHLAKNFESLFGGVTCLPGCFSAYRIKTPKGTQGFWVPILANPDIIEEYSQNVVDTLHKKNLLLLGEDRFLSTLMLKTFPKRQMIFLPQATCETVVPDTFRVLLSQRRRWINSTVHNLAELVFVNDLCGTFCFSMQFVVMLELLGTIVLPAAICFTIVLIYSVAVVPSESFVQNGILPLMTLLIILILPSIVIIVMTRKWSFIIYLFIYLLALIIWNFVLPVYSFWHFDDFSWGKTREVAGDAEGADDHSRKQGEFDGSTIVMKRWSEWEQSGGKPSKRRQPNSERRVGPRTSSFRPARNNALDAVVSASRGHQYRQDYGPSSADYRSETSSSYSANRFNDQAYASAFSQPLASTTQSAFSPPASSAAPSRMYDDQRGSQLQFPMRAHYREKDLPSSPPSTSSLSTAGASMSHIPHATARKKRGLASSAAAGNNRDTFIEVEEDQQNI